MKTLTIFLRSITFTFLGLSCLILAAPLPKLNTSVGSAQAITSNDQLTVTTGTLTRTWKLTPHGLQTLSLTSQHGQIPTIPAINSMQTDWEAKGWIDSSTPAEFVSLTSRESTDSHFTSKHLEVVAEFRYPQSKTVLRYVIWAYPGADGIRTQLWMKDLGAANNKTVKAIPPDFIVDAGKSTDTEISHEKAIVMRVGPLDAAKNYILETFCPAGIAATQDITIASIDNENKVLVPAPKDPSSPAKANLAIELRPNNFVTLRIRSKDSKTPARISSARIVESTGAIVAEITPASPAAKGTQPHKHNTHTKQSHRTDWLPVTPHNLYAIGYYNDTQNRHTPQTPLLRAEAVNHGITSWASILCLEPEISSAAALAVVKESHKCANQTGVDTGAFLADATGLTMTGFGISRSDLRANEWRWAWANWIIAYPTASSPAALADSRELALKKFQRLRYPVRAELDLYLKANTWGSGIDAETSVARAAEKEVLAEIESVADLGLETLQIDDGWQKGRMAHKPPAQAEWEPRPDWYPDGWKNVTAAAAAKKIDLGIWLAARAPLNAMIKNYDLAHFKTWKLDFANLSNYDGVQSYLEKGRSLIEHTQHKIRVNWDVTEIPPRYGYYWASECGNLWLANRKPLMPTSVVPKPWLMLREVREISRYLNINKIELPIQNFAMVDPKISDAHLHSTTYSTALGLAGIPVFFQTTRLLTAPQREEIKGLLEQYKKHRAAMFHSYVFPIGDEPDNQSWSGLQWHNPENPQTGYLLIFRERLNQQAEATIPLRFLSPGKKLTTENIITSQRSTHTLDEKSAATFQQAQAGGILFLQYVVE